VAFFGKSEVGCGFDAHNQEKFSFSHSYGAMPRNRSATPPELVCLNFPAQRSDWLALAAINSGILQALLLFLLFF